MDPCRPDDQARPDPRAGAGCGGSASWGPPRGRCCRCCEVFAGPRVSPCLDPCPRRPPAPGPTSRSSPSTHVTFGYGGAPVLQRRRPRRRRRVPSPASSGPSGSGKTSLLRLLLGTEKPAARQRPPRAGHRRLLRAAARDGELELPGHRRRVRAHGAPDAAAAAVGDAGRRRPRSPPSSSGSASPTSRTGTSASSPAASSSACSSPAPCCAGPTCCSWTSRRPASTSRPATRCCTCSTSSTPTGSRSC